MSVSLADEAQPTIYALHQGSITRFKRLVIESWIHNGYRVRIVTYNDIARADTLVKPAAYVSADDYIPGGLARQNRWEPWRLSRMLQFAVLERERGLWMRLDMVLREPLPDGPLAYATPTQLLGDPVRCPPEKARQLFNLASEAPTDDVFREWARGCWELPLQASELVEPLPETDLVRALHGPYPLPEEAIAVRFWGRSWRQYGCSHDAKHADSSLYETFWNRYFN